MCLKIFKRKKMKGRWKLSKTSNIGDTYQPIYKVDGCGMEYTIGG